MSGSYRLVAFSRISFISYKYVSTTITVVEWIHNEGITENCRNYIYTTRWLLRCPFNTWAVVALLYYPRFRVAIFHVFVCYSVCKNGKFTCGEPDPDCSDEVNCPSDLVYYSNAPHCYRRCDFLNCTMQTFTGCGCPEELVLGPDVSKLYRFTTCLLVYLHFLSMSTGYLHFNTLLVIIVHTTVVM